jgi:type IV pilus assembly protein PilO
MDTRLKIIIIIAILVVIILLGVLVALPNTRTGIKNSIDIEKEKEENIALKNRLNELLAMRDEYHLLNAENQRYILQLPPENDISIFTNEIYDIAGYSFVNIHSIGYSEKSPGKEEEKLGLAVIEASISLEGSYYNIMAFLNAMERMPRIVKVDNIIMQASSDNHEIINAYINIKFYYRT